MNEVNICNLALSLIGNKTITSIETPVSTEEKICSLWYDTTRKQALIEASPNFARARKYIPLSNIENPFGFKYAYQKPNDCLKVLGIGETYETQHNYCVEGNYIFTDDNENNSLPIRYIRDESTINYFSPAFIQYFACCLAVNICYQLNKDNNVKQLLEVRKQQELIRTNTTDNQESKIMIIHRNDYEASRYGLPYRRIQK
ncbi:hypothetical protein J5751_04865 [bacterium]|nr:hypothetical protein [bacterium]